MRACYVRTSLYPPGGIPVMPIIIMMPIMAEPAYIFFLPKNY
jgi:hypothetical protein